METITQPSEEEVCPICGGAPYEFNKNQNYCKECLREAAETFI